MTSKTRESKSPWQRYKKVKFQYSEQLQRLMRALKGESGGGSIRKLAEEHDRYCYLKFGPTGAEMEAREQQRNA